MRCDRVQEHLSLLQDGEAGRLDPLEVERHVYACADCGEFQEVSLDTADGYRMDCLRGIAAFRALERLPAARPGGWLRGARFRRLAFLVTAAGIAVAVLVGVTARFPKSGPSRGDEVRSAARAASAAPAIALRESSSRAFLERPAFDPEVVGFLDLVKLPTLSRTLVLFPPPADLPRELWGEAPSSGVVVEEDLPSWSRGMALLQ